MIRAVVDDRLAVQLASERRLVYTDAAVGDRPPHVRAASALAAWNGGLAVIQDDASYVAIVQGERVESIALPWTPGGRSHFEHHTKRDKLDLEACIVLDGALVAFGSGSIAGVRDHIVRVADGVTLIDAHPFYEALRDAIGTLDADAPIGGGAFNLEGAAIVGNELWLFHRGNTGPRDPGPAIARLELAAFRAMLDATRAREIQGGSTDMPGVAAIELGERADLAQLRVERCELGMHDGVAFGFTDATVHRDRVFVAFATEASHDAIADGAVGACRIGVLDGDVIRCAALPPRKLEGLAFVADRLFATIDPDDPDEAAPLCELALVGPW